MYRIILVDDEPLILAGIASLLNWEDWDCTIVGKATNGPTAYDMIMELQPDIVITDIRMPVLNGLELVKKCKDNGSTFSFIVLTNLEEFQLVKTALSLGATDYLVKLNMTPEALSQALVKAKEACDLLINKQQHKLLNSLLKNNTEDLIRNFFEKILLAPSNEPVTEKEIILEEEDLFSCLNLQIEEQFPSPFALLLSLRNDNISFNPMDGYSDSSLVNKQVSDIISGISSRFFKGFTIIEYNINTYLIIASFKNNTEFNSTLTGYCTKINAAIKTYFEFTAVFGISPGVDNIYQLKFAINQAYTALEYYYYDSSSPIVFYQSQQVPHSNARSFNINFLKKDLSTSIQQNDSEKLQYIFNQIIDLFSTCKPNKEHATSACINIYTYLYSFFENEDDSYGDIFPYTINIAEQLNRFSCLSDILEWIQSFCNKLTKLLTDRKETRSDKLIDQTKKYVNAHYTEKMTLTDIAEVLNISPGYLSSTFKKFTGTTLSDYIAYIKIEHAKELIDTHQYLMYEISDQLGFDNPYYFSKVFKKITGISPREHENR